MTEGEVMTETKSWDNMTMEERDYSLEGEGIESSDMINHLFMVEYIRKMKRDIKLSEDTCSVLLRKMTALEDRILKL